MARKRNTNVLFVVKYADGREATIEVDQFTLRSGDHIARVIALETQQGGLIPAGDIVSVRRLLAR